MCPPSGHRTGSTSCCGAADILSLSREAHLLRDRPGQASAPFESGSLDGVTEVLVGDLMVARFAPFSAEKIKEKAERDYERLRMEGKPPVYAISTFAIVRPDEQTTIDDLITTICQSVKINGRKVAVTTRRHLEAEGFRVERSEPPAHHHDVVLGDELREMDVKRLEALLLPGVRRNPAWPPK